MPHPVHSNVILGPLFINIFRLGHAAREGPFRHSCIISLVASVAESVKYRSGVCPSVCLSVCPIIFYIANILRRTYDTIEEEELRRRISAGFTNDVVFMHVRYDALTSYSFTLGFGCLAAPLYKCVSVCGMAGYMTTASTTIRYGYLVHRNLLHEINIYNE